MIKLQSSGAFTQKANTLDRMINARELKLLPQLLQSDEILLDAVHGCCDDRIGLLCATNQRLLFVHKGVFFGSHVDAFPLGAIAAASYKTGIVMGSFYLQLAGDMRAVTHIENAALATFHQCVSAQLRSSARDAQTH